MASRSTISLRRQPLFHQQALADNDISLHVSLVAHGKVVTCPKRILMAICVSLKEKLLPLATPGMIEVSDDFPNAAVFQHVMAVIKGGTVAVGDKLASEIIHVLESWLGTEGSNSIVVHECHDKTRITLTCEGELLVNVLHAEYDEKDRTMFLQAHGERFQTNRFLLSQRCPVLRERLANLKMPGSVLDVTDEVEDPITLGVVVALVDGKTVTVEAPHDTYVQKVLHSWVYDPKNVIVKKVKAGN